MDEIVEQALRKWPNVPDCYGWLGLDARGQWHMRDAATQSRGPFPTLLHPAQHTVRGSCLRHDKLIAFIGRNYGVDARGCWFFQNGPQRVYIELEATPWVWRVRKLDHGEFTIHSHTGLHTHASDCWLDEVGRLYLTTPLGLGLVHSQDVLDAAEAVEAGLWHPQETGLGELLARHGIVLSPTAHRHRR